MRAIPKTAKIHPAAKKCCGWEKPAIWMWTPKSQAQPQLANLVSLTFQSTKATHPPTHP